MIELTREQGWCAPIPLGKKNKVSERLSDGLSKVADLKSKVAAIKPDFLPSLRLFDAFDETERLFANLKKKSVIGFFGNSGSGKSTLVNTVIGEDVLPTGESPTTRLVTLVGHSEYRPSSLSAKVALFKKGFSPHMIHNPDHVAGHLLEQGGEELLSRGGDAYFAVVFCTTDICRHVWLMDTPGDIYGTGGEKALGSVELADGFVLLSPHSHFLRHNDLGLLSNIIRRCPPVKAYQITNHMLFVQSHCGDIEFGEIRAVFEDVIERTKRRLYDTAFEFLEEGGLINALPGEEELAARVQPFWRENERLATRTIRRINDMAEYLVLNNQRTVEDDIERALNRINRVFHNAIDVSEALEYTMKKAPERSKEAKDRIDQFQSSGAARVVNRLVDLAKSCEREKSHDLKAMSNYFEVIVSEKFLVPLIEQGFGDEKEAREEIGSYVGQLLSLRLEGVLEQSGKSMSAEVEELLSEWQRTQPSMRSLHASPGSEDPEYGMSAFDPRAKFMEGLRGPEALGAMSLYVRSYIAANMGKSVFTGGADGYLLSLGLANHVTKAVSFVAALGSPVTLGLASTAAIGRPDQGLGAASWRKDLAAEVVRRLSEKNVRAECERMINDFWKNTEGAIAAGLTGVRRGSDEYLTSVMADISREYTESEVDAYGWAVRKASDSLSPEAPAKMGRAVLLTSIILAACTLAFILLHFHDHHDHGGFLP